MNDQYIRATPEKLKSKRSASKDSELKNLHLSPIKNQVLKSSIPKIYRIPKAIQKKSEIKPLKPALWSAGHGGVPARRCCCGSIP